MGLPDSPVALSPEQIAELNKKLSVMRHNVNNHLALVVAASELMRRRPELALRLVENIVQQPERINIEIRAFSDAFDSAFSPRLASAGLPPVALGVPPSAPDHLPTP